MAHDRYYKDGERWAVITMEPGGFAPRVVFRDSYETAMDHARMLRRDLGRDAYVAPLKAAFYADRKGA